MLPSRHRLRRPAEFQSVIRSGRRTSRPLLTLHVLVAAGSAAPPRAGLVVSKAVGPSVTRHRVSRQLRHLVRDRLDRLPDGALVVVRAAPAAASAASGALGEDLDAALARVLA